MKGKVETVVKSRSTEEKIKEAARKVFTQKGYAATRTRDIAEEAGLNLALLNYYFRSKEKLYDMIMIEAVQGFASRVSQIVNNEYSTFYEKTELIADNYIDFLMEHPGLPLFIINAMNDDPKKFFSKLGFDRTVTPVILRQLRDILKEEGKALHPANIMVNTMGMIVFPFLTGPIAQKMGNIDKVEFIEMMHQRKKLIPVWIEAMIKSS